MKKEIVEDLLKLGVDVSKLTESKMNALANKIANSRDITQKDAKKIVAAAIKKAASGQRSLANVVEKYVRSAAKKAQTLTKKKGSAKRKKKR